MRTRLARSVLLALALAPAVAAAQVESPPPPVAVYADAAEHVRRAWYIGFGVGSGVGSLTYGGKSISFAQYLSDYESGYDPYNVALQFEVGATLRPDLLLGLDVRLLRAQSNRGVDAGVQATDYLAMLTWFPRGEGLFVRGGAGFAALTQDYFDSAGGRLNDTTGGLGVLGGVGYAFWLGRRFNLTLNADASAQVFADSSTRPTSSRFLDLYLGFSWY